MFLLREFKKKYLEILLTIFASNFRAPLDKEEYFLILKDYCHRAVQSFDACKNWYDASLQSEAEDCDGNQEVSFKPGKKYEDLLQIFTVGRT